MTEHRESPQQFAPQVGADYKVVPRENFAVPVEKRRGWVVAIVVVLCVFAFLALSMWSCTSVLGSSLSVLESSDNSDLANIHSDTIGIIRVDGTIGYDNTTSSPEGIKAQLDAAEKNPFIKAVVLRVNSGGGTATAGEEMASYVHDFSKPLVVSCASMDASAAYMISSQADYIFTAKTSAVGAIGVAMQVTDLSGLMDKLGISIDNIISSKSKDSSYGTRPLSDEERTYYQNMVNQINDVFIQTVADGRNMSTDDVRALATGMTFTGMDAVNNKLVDQLGTQQDAVAKAAELAQSTTRTTVELQQKPSGLSKLIDVLSNNKSASFGDIAQALKELEHDGSSAN